MAKAEHLSRADALAALERVRTETHRRFPTSQRLEHLDAHLATVAMVVNHIHDEAEREQG